MKLYVLFQVANNDFDTYDSCVVVANNEEEARVIYPGNDDRLWDNEKNDWYSICFDGTRSYWGKDRWAEPKDVTVEYIGEADSHYQKPEVILASYNAG